MKFDNANYRKLANLLRGLAIDAVEAAKSGHPGMPLGIADVATVLYSDFMRFDPANPKWPDRDRFVLSAGHGSILLYSILFLTGYADVGLDDIKNFRQLGSKTPGHPEYGEISGIETTTGPLGQGFANAVGMAISLKKANSQAKVYCISGDGCLMEGISHEAASIAGHLNLDNLIIIFDSNKITIDGSTELTESVDNKKRFESYGFEVIEANGHDYQQIHAAFKQANAASRPVLIIFNTTIAFGSVNKAGKSSSHGAPLGAEEVFLTKQFLGLDPSKTFDVDENLLKIWRSFAAKSAPENSAHKIINKQIDHEIFVNLKKNEVPNESTRKSSGRVVEKLLELPIFLGGSADLSESNFTSAKNSKPLQRADFSGNYIHYGIREHAMAAIMNGIALEAEFIPYAGTFLVFSDYLKPAIRLSALMKLQVIYIFTHDSIGVGEDGPTHQPVEQLAMLRSIPNLCVIRPCDYIETIEAWEVAVSNKNLPTAICLSRQNILQINNCRDENLLKKGAYIIREAANSDSIKVTLFATGSEVSIAIDVAARLENLGFSSRVVSVPSFELFFQQEIAYQNILLKNNSLKVAIEAASEFGWHKIIGENSMFFGLNNFGASAKSEDLFKLFGISSENICNKILENLER